MDLHTQKITRICRRVNKITHIHMWTWIQSGQTDTTMLLSLAWKPFSYTHNYIYMYMYIFVYIFSYIVELSCMHTHTPHLLKPPTHSHRFHTFSCLYNFSYFHIFLRSLASLCLSNLHINIFCNQFNSFLSLSLYAFLRVCLYYFILALLSYQRKTATHTHKYMVYTYL